MFNENRQRAVTLAKAHLARVPDVLRRIARLEAAEAGGPLVREASRLIDALEEDLGRLHSYGNAYVQLTERIVWARARLEEALDDGVRYRVRPEAVPRLLEHAAFLEGWGRGGG